MKERTLLFLVILGLSVSLIFLIKHFSYKKNGLWKKLTSFNPTQEKPIVIVIPSYNNKDWYEKNLKSVLTQNYKNYRIIYLDDVSTDRTGELIKKFIKKIILKIK